MARIRYLTCDVFTDTPFEGNPLAVFPDAGGLSASAMLCLAQEFGYAETTFVQPPRDGGFARVRIFTTLAEVPFAGHPNIGTAAMLALDGRLGGSDEPESLVFEELAGPVRMQVERIDHRRARASLVTPHPWRAKAQVPVGVAAACAGLAPGDIVVDTHQPVMGGVGLTFCFAQVADRQTLARADYDVGAFRRADRDHPHSDDAFSLYLYARQGDRIDARMFAPLAAPPEDPATGSAAAGLTALLAGSGCGDRFTVRQGEDMGRPGMIVTAMDGDLVRVEGEAVKMMEGWIDV
ncbi:MAG: PhzF family phenazine biosynthesis protein [Rubricella sp.]